MKTTKRLAITALAPLLYAGAALSADPAGWYIGGDLGYSKTSTAEWMLSNGWAPSHPTPFDSSWMGALKVGKDFGAWRGEVEYAHRSEDAKHFGPPPYDVDNAKGDITSNSLMLNVYYDLTTTNKATPYLGIGIGASNVEANNIRKDLAPTDCCSGIVDGSDTVAAIQLVAGLAYEAAPNLDITLEYRYFLANKPDFNYATACSGSDSIGDCGIEGKTSDQYRNQSVLIGLRYRF